MRKASFVLCFVLLITILISQTEGQSGLKFEPIWTTVEVFTPVDMDFNSNTVYTTSILGTIIQFPYTDSNDAESTIFFNISNSNTPNVTFYTSILEGGEDGLLSMAFHPSYPSVPKFYTFYSSSPTSIQVTSWEVENGVVNYNNADILMTIEKTAAMEARLGGDLQFDYNGYLYIAVGNGANRTASRDPSNRLGKILRIIPNANSQGYTIPDSNPLAFSSNEVAREIYSKGYRNPRKITFPLVNSTTLWVGEVGDTYDEIISLEQIIDQEYHEDYYQYYDQCPLISAYPSKFPFYYYTSKSSHTLTLGVYYPPSSNPLSFKEIENQVLFADLYSGYVNGMEVTDNFGNCGVKASNVTHTQAAISSFLLVNTSVYITDTFAYFYDTPTYYRLANYY